MMSTPATATASSLCFTKHRIRTGYVWNASGNGRMAGWILPAGGWTAAALLLRFWTTGLQSERLRGLHRLSAIHAGTEIFTLSNPINYGSSNQRDVTYIQIQERNRVCNPSRPGSEPFSGCGHELLFELIRNWPRQPYMVPSSGMTGPCTSSRQPSGQKADGYG